MRRVALSRSGRGVLVLISDMLLREGYLPGLSYIAGVGRSAFDATCLRVLSPDELDPARGGEALAGDLRLTDAETGRAAEVTVSAALLRRYRQRLDRYIGDLESACLGRRIQHMVVPSDTPLDTLVLGSLRKRGLLG